MTELRKVFLVHTMTFLPLESLWIFEQHSEVPESWHVDVETVSVNYTHYAMGTCGAGFSSVNYSWPQISNNTTSCCFTDYSGSEENTDVSQELSPEKSIVTKCVSSNKSSAHPGALLHCSDSAQHRGKSKPNGKTTPSAVWCCLSLPVNAWAGLMQAGAGTHDVNLAIRMQDDPISFARAWCCCFLLWLYLHRSFKAVVLISELILHLFAAPY